MHPIVFLFDEMALCFVLVCASGSAGSSTHQGILKVLFFSGRLAPTASVQQERLSL
jgi:hypothetical protein